MVLKNPTVTRRISSTFFYQSDLIVEDKEQRFSTFLWRYNWQPNLFFVVLSKWRHVVTIAIIDQQGWRPSWKGLVLTESP